MSGDKDIDLVALNAALAEQRVDLDGWVEDLDSGGKRLRLEYAQSETARETGQPQFEDGSITHLTYRRPQATDLDYAVEMEAVANPMIPLRKLVAAMTGHQIDKVGKLDSDDWARASQVALDFLDRKRLLVKSPTEETPLSSC